MPTKIWGKGRLYFPGAAQEGHTESLQLLLADARVEPVNKVAFLLMVLPHQG